MDGKAGLLEDETMAVRLFFSRNLPRYLRNSPFGAIRKNLRTDEIHNTK